MDNKKHVFYNLYRVYSNVKIPSTWKQKLDYRDVMYSTLNNDKVFFHYLSQNNVQTEENKENLIKKKKQLQKEEEILPNIEDKSTYDRKKTNMSTLMRTTNNFNFSNNTTTLAMSIIRSLLRSK